MTQTLTDRPTTAYAWTVMESPNLDFGTTHALVYLAVAEVSDRKLNSPEGLNLVTYQDLDALLPRVSTFDVLEAVVNLISSGLLVNHFGGFRFPEEAYS